MANNEMTAAEKLLNRLKDNRWIAWLIVAGVVLIALSKFGEAVTKLAAILPLQQRKAQFDTYNQEKVLEVAKHVDDFFSRAIAVTQDQIPFPSIYEELRKISVEFRDLELRDSVRPLNSVSTKQIEIVRDNWESTIDLFRWNKLPSPAFLQQKRAQERQMFSVILRFPDKDN